MSKLVKVFWGFFCVFVLLLLFSLFVPNMLWLTLRANDSVASQNMQALGKVQERYRENHPEKGFSCSLSELGKEDARLGTPENRFAWLVDTEVGQKSGYTFTLSNCRTVVADGKSKVVGYKLFAVPQALNRTGTKGFCSDERGKVMVDPHGGTECTEPKK